MQDAAASYDPIDIINISDREYELHCRKCPKCSGPHYQIWRWIGASFACYRMQPDFHPDDFAEFVEMIDAQLLQCSAGLLYDLHSELEKVNSPQGIEADWSFSFRLIDYARDRASFLRRTGHFGTLLHRGSSEDEFSQVLKAAFELGSAAAEHRIMVNYEKYFWDGIAMSEWRDAGLPKAVEERRRQGARTRALIVEAARELYSKNPALIRNDLETARQIIKMRLPGLQKGNGIQLSVDAITRHIRSARKALQRQEN
jgi:hypothetical protein